MTGAAGSAERFAVSRRVAAAPDAVWALVTDPAGHVAVDSSGMLMGAEGAPVTAVGDAFVVHMDREALNDHPLGTYDVQVVITALEPGRQVEWTVTAVFTEPLEHRYGYLLAPDGDGTHVTSYYDWSRVPDRYRSAVFPVIPEATLRASLGILARTLQP